MLLKYISIPLMFLSFLQKWIGQISSAKTSPVNLRPEHARRCTRIRTRMRTHVRTRMHTQASGCAHDSNIKSSEKWIGFWKKTLKKTVYIYIYIYTHTHTRTHARMHARTRKYACVYTHFGLKTQTVFFKVFFQKKTSCDNNNT